MTLIYLYEITRKDKGRITESTDNNSGQCRDRCIFQREGMLPFCSSTMNNNPHVTTENLSIFVRQGEVNFRGWLSCTRSNRDRYISRRRDRDNG